MGHSGSWGVTAFTHYCVCWYMYFLPVTYRYYPNEVYILIIALIRYSCVYLRGYPFSYTSFVVVWGSIPTVWVIVSTVWVVDELNYGVSNGTLRKLGRDSFHTLLCVLVYVLPSCHI